ncbi:DoxX family protein [Flavobacterium sp. FlaQc-47]|uniref:DoxX family protein n=1 Tax=Flavobacterium sp. FlaQc-47 TaxID=3374180 RepID=UPI0037573E52
MNKTGKIIYWASTGIISVMMLFSAWGYLASADMKAAFEHLGFPGYFRIELGILKALGALVLVVPLVWDKIKLLAYFGFALTFISASIAHYASGDSVAVSVVPIIFLAILGVSYIFYVDDKVQLK